MKSTKVIYWTATLILFLFEGVLPALTSHTELAVEGIRHLGYPSYFGAMLTVFKVIGAVALVMPTIKGRYKEWVYAGFGINLISATVSHCVVDGIHFQSLFPSLIFGILIVSYVYYHRLNKHYTQQSVFSL